uniref:Uncharacterized protein n=1 Tax=Macrostomum lignano TaxID=282301 RepID=A0A1I8J161_9PLAT
MKFIVIFHVDKEIVELSETEVLLENFQKFTLDNWRNFVGEPIARAYYNEQNLQTESESDCQRSPSSFSRSVRLPQAEDSARAVQQSPSSLPLLPLPETRNPSAQLAVETAPPETPKSLPHHGQNDRCRSQQSAAELLSPSDQPGALRFNAAAADVASLNFELKQCMSRAAAAAATTFGPVDADAEWKPIATWPDYIDFIKNPPALEWMTRLLLPCKADDLGSTIRR